MLLTKIELELRMNCTTPDSSTSESLTNLVAMDTHVMSGDESLENDHPACIGGPLKQRVSHLRDVHVGGVGGWHQICNTAAESPSFTQVQFSVRTPKVKFRKEEVNQPKWTALIKLWLSKLSCSAQRSSWSPWTSKWQSNFVSSFLSFFFFSALCPDAWYADGCISTSMLHEMHRVVLRHL